MSLTLTEPCLNSLNNDLQYLMSSHLPNDPSLNRHGIGSYDFAKQNSNRNEKIETFIVNRQIITELSLNQLRCRDVMKDKKRILK